MLPELPRSRYLGVRFHKRVAAHVNAVQAIAFSPDGKRLVTASHDRTARVFDTDTWEMKLALPDHGGPVLGAAFTTDQRSIITAGGTSVFQWDAATGKPIRSVDTGVRSGAVGISPAGDSAWVAGWDGRIRSFKLPSLDPGPLLDASPDKGRVIAVGFSPNGKSFAAAGDDGHIRFWLPPDAKVVRDLPAHAGPVNKVRFNPEGTMFASAGDDGAVHLFHIDAPKPISTFRASQTEAWEAAFSPRSDLLITGDKNGLLGAWHLPGGNLAWRARPHEGRGIIQAQVSPDNEWLAVAMGNGAVEVYAIPPAGDAKAIPEPKPIRRARPEPTTLAQKAQRIVDDSITNPSLRVDEAGELAAKAIAENPKDALALVQAGRVARLRGYISGSRYQPAAIELAQQMSKRALEANPSLFEAKELAAWLALTEATNRPGPFEAADFDKARAAADVVVSADVTRLEGEVLHAVIANYEGSHEAAVVRATRVIQQSDDDRLIHMGYQELIEALTKLGRLDAADAAHQKLLAFSPQSAWIRGGYARFLLRRGKRDDAIEMAKKAIDLMNYPAAHHIIADALVDRGVQLLWDRGNVAEARKAFDAALTEEPGSADARYGVLACDAAEAEKRGTPCDSCELGLVQLLALDPKHEQALWVQKQLGRGAFSPRK
jgi:tetratricopeptide (TPR) repeat protein